MAVMVVKTAAGAADETVAGRSAGSRPKTGRRERAVETVPPTVLARIQTGGPVAVVPYGKVIIVDFCRVNRK